MDSYLEELSTAIEVINADIGKEFDNLNTRIEKAIEEIHKLLSDRKYQEAIEQCDAVSKDITKFKSRVDKISDKELESTWPYVRRILTKALVILLATSVLCGAVRVGINKYAIDKIKNSIDGEDDEVIKVDRLDAASLTKILHDRNSRKLERLNAIKKDVVDLGKKTHRRIGAAAIVTLITSYIKETKNLMRNNKVTREHINQSLDITLKSIAVMRETCVKKQNGEDATEAFVGCLEAFCVGNSFLKGCLSLGMTDLEAVDAMRLIM